MTTVASLIRRIVLSLLLIAFHSHSFAGEGERGKDHDFHELGIFAGGNISVVFSESKAVESWSLKYTMQPVFGLSVDRFFKQSNWGYNLSLSYNLHQSHFAADVRDQEYSGYIEQRVGTQIKEGYIEDAYFTGHTEGYYRLHYSTLAANLLFKGNFLGCNMHFQFGGYAGVLMKGESVVTANGTVALGAGLPAISTEFTRDQNYSDELQRLDAGINFGFEGKLFSGVSLICYARKGLTSIYKENEAAPPGSFTNLSLTFGLKYVFERQTIE